MRHSSASYRDTDSKSLHKTNIFSQMSATIISIFLVSLQKFRNGYDILYNPNSRLPPGYKTRSPPFVYLNRNMNTIPLKSFFTALTSLTIALSLPAAGLDGSTAADTPSALVLPQYPSDNVINFDGFPLGADVGWITELEANGEKFYDADGKPVDGIKLLKDECGINSIRLRVWVNPEGGWNGKEDVLLKARRAQQLNLPLMIDFHFSDSWADPSQQRMPVAWREYSTQQLTEAVAAHVTDVLSALKSANIDVRWIQVGNEVPNGMMHPAGLVKGQETNDFPALFTAGYKASKAIYPETPVILHIDRGNNAELYTDFFDLMKRDNVEYDMIGMSFYPWPYDQWEQQTADLIDNIKRVKERYGKPVMICEIGLHYDMADECNEMLTRLLKEYNLTKSFEGIFYWEPEAPAGYNGGYDKSCFKEGRPTRALAPFKTFKPVKD